MGSFFKDILYALSNVRDEMKGFDMMLMLGAWGSLVGTGTLGGGSHIHHHQFFGFRYRYTIGREIHLC